MLLISPFVGFACAALLFLLSKAFIKYPALYEAPKGNTPPPWPIRLLLVLTCSGVSFSHGSNDGQKGMGLIMLILIGTVPTAYALNHAVSPKTCRTSSLSSEGRPHPQQSRRSSRTSSAPTPAQRSPTTSAPSNCTPSPMLALRELVQDLNHEVAIFKGIQVCACQPADQRPQRHVRGQRSDPAHAEKQAAGIHARKRTPLSATTRSTSTRPRSSFPRGSRLPSRSLSAWAPWSAGSASSSPSAKRSARST